MFLNSWPKFFSETEPCKISCHVIIYWLLPDCTEVFLRYGTIKLHQILIIVISKHDYYIIGSKNDLNGEK